MEGILIQVIWSTAMTLDGKIGLSSEHELPFVISDTHDLRRVHKLRASCDAIGIGVGTVCADDPYLTVRYGNRGKTPFRIVFDGSLRSPLSSNVFKDQKTNKTIVFCHTNASSHTKQQLKSFGVTVISLPYSSNSCAHSYLDLTSALNILESSYNVDRFLLEGGSTLNSSFLRNSLIDEIYIYVSLKILGELNTASLVSSSFIDFNPLSHFIIQDIQKFTRGFLLTLKQE